MLYVASTSVCYAQHVSAWGDQKDGTYSNPILSGDFQNTDVIRVGSNYYYISATKQLSPGMLIMTSTDLVNWTMIGHAVSDITQISQRYSYTMMQGTNRGVWAGSIRHHNNTYWIHFTDPDEGIFMTTATNPAGPWSPLTSILKAAGWDDPCPLWDSTGQGYLVATNFADNYKIHLFKMSSNGQLVMDSDQVIYQSKGSEANKLYKINDYYYHFYSEVTKEGRMPYMARSKNITGPYTERRQLIHKAEGEPNQGGLVQTEKGDWYFLTHHGKAYWDGREVSLLPVTWKDGWPIWGTPGEDSIGTMVWSAKKTIGHSSSFALQTSDEFNTTVLSPQWEWHFQPRNEKWSLRERPNFLRLYACKALEPGVLTKTTNVLTQRPFRTEQNIATLKLDISNMHDGQVAGLCLFGKTSGSIGIMQIGKIRQFYFNESGNVIQASPTSSLDIWLQASWNKSGLANFYYSTNGSNFIPIGSPYQITNFGNYLGAKIGIFTANDTQEKGFIDVDWFHYDFK